MKEAGQENLIKKTLFFNYFSIDLDNLSLVKNIYKTFLEKFDCLINVFASLEKISKNK